MAASGDEEELLRSVALQNARGIQAARQRTEEALRRQTELLRVTLASIGDAVISTDADGRVTFLNGVAEALTGWPQAEAAGRPLPEVFRIVNEQTRQPVENPATRALREGRIVGLANHTVLIARDGTERPIDDSAAPIRDEAGATVGAVLVFRDVTERRRADAALRESEARHRFLAELAAATQPLADPADIMQAAARLLAEHLGADRCAYAEVEGEDVFVITGDHPRGVPSIVGRWPVAAFGAACERLMRADEPYVVDDVDGDPRIGPADVPAYRATTMRAVICVPLHKGGKFTAAMAVHQAAARRWTPAEVELVRTVAGRCWEALERARVARTLRESEARYRAIVEATPECVKLVAPDGTVLQMNSAGLSMVEADGPGAAVGRCVFDLIAPEHRAAFRAFHERVCRGEGGVLAYEIVGLRGGRRHLETAAVPMPAPTGGFHHLAVTRDVTARAAAEKALAESRARLDYAVRVSGIGFWYCDLPFDVLRWDERVKAHFWLPPDAVVTIDTFYDRVHPDDREPTRRAIDAAIRDRAPYDVDFRTVDPDTGTVKWVRALGGADYGPGGEPVRFDGVTVDVTDQKLAEEVARRGAERLRLAVEIARMGTFEIDLTDDTVTVNEPGRAIYGWPSTRTTFAQVQSHFHPDDKPEVLRRVSAALDPAGPGTFEVEQRIVRTDGALRWIRVRGRAFFEGDGPARAAARLLGAYLDVTDRREMEDALRATDRKKDEFIALLAHELRNPLAPIRNGLQVMRLAPLDAAAVAQARAMMDRQLGHMVRLIDDLLDVSRISRNKMELRRERVPLADVVSSAVETARPLIDAAGHELNVSLPQRPVYLDADLTRLAQVFSNLLSNSAKYTEPGGRIWLSAERNGGVVVVSVRDTGIGIPAAALPNIFDMFSQVDRSIERNTGGLGIGLALVRGLVEMHGGTVTAASPGPGEGTTFTVTLPVVAGQPEPPPAADEDVPAAGPGRRILVVDDNRDGADSLALMLRFLGNDVRTAHDGLQAVAAAAEFRPEVILMDVGMPKLNGLDATRRLRAEPWGRGITIIALTGWGQEEDRVRSREAGCDGHLVKPVHLPDLAKMLAEKHPGG